MSKWLVVGWSVGGESVVGFSAIGRYNKASLSTIHIPSLKDYPHNLTKHDERVIQKSKFSNTLVNWEEFGSAA